MLEGISIVALVLGIIALAFSAYHFFMMFDNFKQEKRPYIYLLGPIAFFLPSWLNSDGIYHRLRLGVSLAAFALLGLLFAGLRPMW